MTFALRVKRSKHTPNERIVRPLHKSFPILHIIPPAGLSEYEGMRWAAEQWLKSKGLAVPALIPIWHESNGVLFFPVFGDLKKTLQLAADRIEILLNSGEDWADDYDKDAYTSIHRILETGPNPEE